MGQAHTFSAPAMKRPSGAVKCGRLKPAVVALKATKSELSVVPKDGFYAASRAKWREWLKKNFESRSYVWLVCPKKAGHFTNIL